MTASVEVRYPDAVAPMVLAFVQGYVEAAAEAGTPIDAADLLAVMDEAAARHAKRPRADVLAATS